jgi:hypothetical protein
MLAFVATVGAAGCGNQFGLVPLTDTLAHPHARPDSKRLDAAVDAPPDAMVDPKMYLDAKEYKDAKVFLDAPPPTCPTSYFATGGGRVINVHRTGAIIWPMAQQACMDERGNATNYTHLAVMATDQERGDIGASVTGGGATDVWIGLSDRKSPDSFVWVSTETIITYPDLSPWDQDEPSTGAGDDCVVMKASTVTFDAVNCGLPYGYVCECDAYPSDPNRY